MSEQIYLGLDELLSADMSGYEYWCGLPQNVREKLSTRDITTFSELQRAAKEEF